MAASLGTTNSPVFDMVMSDCDASGIFERFRLAMTVACSDDLNRKSELRQGTCCTLMLIVTHSSLLLTTLQSGRMFLNSSVVVG